MNIICKLFGHKWNQCKCNRCNQIRYGYGHDFKPVSGKCYDVCTVCGEKNNKTHKFMSVSGKCHDVCAVCGEEDIEAHHVFEPVSGECYGVCSVCGEKSREEHDYKNGKCERCGNQTKAVVQNSDGKYCCCFCGMDVLPIAEKYSMQKEEDEVRRQYPGQSVMWSPAYGHEYRYIRNNKITCSCGKTLNPYKDD